VLQLLTAGNAALLEGDSNFLLCLLLLLHLLLLACCYCVVKRL
jgi:hypothetical protein